jgi:hypothetical protein
VLSVPGDEERRRLARRIARLGLSVRAAERAARGAGARRRPRSSGHTADPVLVERATAALEQMTGVEARAATGRIELPFATDAELAEIVESLEAAAGALRASRRGGVARIAGRAGD